MMVKPAGKAARPLAWSPSLCVIMAVFTVLGVILAISARIRYGLGPHDYDARATTMMPSEIGKQLSVGVGILK